MEYYKKIDKSFFKYGFTIPKNKIDIFLFNSVVVKGCSRPITLIWGKRKFKALLSHVNRKAGEVYQIRWSDTSFKKEIKQEFIQSYIAIENQNYIAKDEGKYYITDLKGGNQEVMLFKPISENSIKIETFIKIETPYSELFRRLVNENVFGWLGSEVNDQMITKDTKWIDAKDIKLHVEKNHVIYYLIDEVNKEIYIGSAKRLGDRVKKNRKEISGWSKFRYEIIHPKFHEQIKQIEYHSIMNFARFLNNSGNLSTLGVSNYTLVNKDYKFYLK
ncbi:MAG: GIY-YIG nuclease family protein [Candidatus Pacebacteria bacterium]|nr:GIY-YIG nuclease family protein [Candidatus Paceibacterota bacterium]